MVAQYDLAILIVSYNTRQLTDDCLASVYAALDAGPLDAQVWVVDNASSDGSAEMIAERHPQAHLIVSDDNLGFAGGNNLAMDAIATSDTHPRHLLLLNPDTLVASDVFRRMVAFLDEHPDAGIAGAQLAYGDGAFQHGAFRFPTLAMLCLDFWPINYRLTDSWLNGRYPRRLYDGDEPFQIDHPLGAALMIRWEVVEGIGQLDTGYFMYCEEIDWCMRARKAGWRAYCMPAARVTHLEGRSARQFRNAMFVTLWRSRYRLFAKHYGMAYQWAARRIIRAGLRSLIRRAQAEERAGADSEAIKDRIDAYRQVMAL